MEQKFSFSIPTLAFVQNKVETWNSSSGYLRRNVQRIGEILFYFDDLRSICRACFGELGHLAPSHPPRRLYGHHPSCRTLWPCHHVPCSFQSSGKTPRHFPGFSSLSTVKPSCPFCLLITTSSVSLLLCCQLGQGHLLFLPKEAPRWFSWNPSFLWSLFPIQQPGRCFIRQSYATPLLKTLQWLPITLKISYQGS